MKLQAIKPLKIATRKCKVCDERLLSIGDSIIIMWSSLTTDRWSFHEECFAYFKNRVNQVNPQKGGFKK